MSNCYTKAVLLINLACIAPISNATEYWVSKIGSDSNNCSSPTLACKTIQRGLNLLLAGDVLNIDEGTYIEDSTASTLTSKCGLLDANYGSLCVKSSGTIDKPIVIRALPGKEGKAIIDSQHKRAGLIISKNDYIHVKNLTFINSWTAGIATPGGPARVPDESFLSIGCRIEGNTILNTLGAHGVNISAVYMWSTKNWIVRNNNIKSVHYTDGNGSNGIQTYGTLNALIENNTITDVVHGINWKDHYVGVTGELYQESIIRNNRFSVSSAGIRISIRGDGSNPAGHNQIEGNIIELTRDSAVGVAAYLTGASATSGSLDVRNNLFIGKGVDHKGINADSLSSLRVIGNIFLNVETAISLRMQNMERPARLIQSDYNVFDENFQIQHDKYSADEENFKTLSAWQKVKPSIDSTLTSLQYDNPDQYSIQLNSTQLTDIKNIRPLPGPNGYSYKPGPYQSVTQFIGFDENLPSRPQPPK